MIKHERPFRVFESGRLYIPKYELGDLLKRKGEEICGRVIGVTFYIGLREFAYWLDGYGNDIPEEQLYKIRKSKER